MAKEKASVQEPEKNEKKTGRIIVDVLLVLALVILFVVSFTAFVTKSGSGVPSFFGIRPFAIQTESMSPTFDPGDLIIDTVVKDTDTLEVGDIITFWTVIQGERVLNTHRIVEISDYENYRAFTTKGDNNTIEDGLTVHENEVVGKYCFRIPKLGSVIDFLQTSTGFLLVIVVPVAIFFVYHLISFFKALFAYQAEKVRLQYEQEAKERRKHRYDDDDDDDYDEDEEEAPKPKKKKKKPAPPPEEDEDEDEDDEEEEEPPKPKKKKKPAPPPEDDGEEDEEEE